MSTEDVPGRLIGGRYELVDVLGRGGMAVVWRALQRGAVGFARPVALKRMSPLLSRSSEALSLFAEEARVGAQLRHPNIVALLDYAHDEQGEPYLVSELVEGIHLGDWVRAHVRARVETPWELVAAIGIEVLRALDAAHTRLDRQGRSAAILHRDVTPGNILLDETGIVKLADFGLARAMDRERMTRPDIVKGKAAYLAPFHKLLAGLGLPLQANQRLDFWSDVGCFHHTSSVINTAHDLSDIHSNTPLSSKASYSVSDNPRSP